MVKRFYINKILVGWGNYFQCGYPKKAFDKVNWYVRNRLYLHFNRESQRGYVLKYAPNFYSELQAMGLHRLTLFGPRKASAAGGDAYSSVSL